VRLLLQRGAAVNEGGALSIPPLTIASAVGDLDAARLLVGNGAHAHTWSMHGVQPLHAACLSGNKDIVTLLLGSGASVDTSTMFGFTPLHIASLFVSVLGTPAAKEAMRNADAATVSALRRQTHEASEWRAQTMSLLLDNGAPADVAAALGITPLHIAALGGNFAGVRVLLDAGANPNALAKLSMVDAQDPDSLMGLFVTGGGLFSSSRKGSSPLHAACISGDIDVVEALIQAGAEVNQKDTKELTPTDVAIAFEHTDIIRALRKHGSSA
jgi:ankyrin repeat protein